MFEEAGGARWQRAAGCGLRATGCGPLAHAPAPGGAATHQRAAERAQLAPLPACIPAAPPNSLIGGPAPMGAGWAGSRAGRARRGAALIWWWPIGAGPRTHAERTQAITHQLKARAPA